MGGLRGDVSANRLLFLKRRGWDALDAKVLLSASPILEEAHPSGLPSLSVRVSASSSGLLLSQIDLLSMNLFLLFALITFEQLSCKYVFYFGANSYIQMGFLKRRLIFMIEPLCSRHHCSHAFRYCGKWPRVSRGYACYLLRPGIIHPIRDRCRTLDR